MQQSYFESISGAKVPNLNNRLTMLEDKIRDISNSNIFNSTKFEQEIDKFFSEKNAIFDNKVNEIIQLFNSDVDKIHKKYKDDLIIKIQDLNSKVDNSHNEVNNLDQAINSYKSTVSTKIQNEISKHYQKKAKMEMWTYWGQPLLVFC
ncbi:hypothetical protein DKE47_002885 [Acinetobacter nosocomialis]|nr:hypothetical protein DKE47_002885 [Acinetobacter nosocomialis]